jgi:MraZ protein
LRDRDPDRRVGTDTRPFFFDGTNAMLRGNALAKVDEKGRLKLPAIFRAAIEPKYGDDFFVTSLRGESVRIYPMEVWLRIEERLARASSLNPPVMRFKNAVNYYGQSAVMDPQGRILIHPLLREKTDTRGEVTVLGLQDFLEVWNRAAFDDRLSGDPLTDADLGELASLGI